MRPLKIDLMSDYTIVNLGDVENVAPKFQMPEGMDVRFPRRHLGCSVGGVGVEKLPPGVRQPFGHTHSEQEEIYVIAEGSGRIKLDDEVHELRLWDVLRIGPGVMRNLEAGPDGITLIAFGAKPSVRWPPCGSCSSRRCTLGPTRPTSGRSSRRSSVSSRRGAT